MKVLTKSPEQFKGLSKISGNDTAAAVSEARNCINANLYVQKGKYKIYHQELNKLRTYISKKHDTSLPCEASFLEHVKRAARV